MELELFELDVCDSTQDEVQERLDVRPPGALVAVCARRQRRGRGRRERRWQQPPGDALLLSVGRNGPIPVEVLANLPQRVWDTVLEVLAAIDPAMREPLRWRPPNDLVTEDGAKVGGVLIDARTTGRSVERAVIGLGLNLTHTPFTTDDGRDATGISLASRDVPVSELLVRVAYGAAALLAPARG